MKTYAGFAKIKKLTKIILILLTLGFVAVSVSGCFMQSDETGDVYLYLAVFFSVLSAVLLIIIIAIFLLLNNIKRKQSGGKITGIREEYERTKLMLDTIPLCCFLVNKDFVCFDSNDEAARLFEIDDKQYYINHIGEFSPEYQPDGKVSWEAALEYMREAFDKGKYEFEWTHRLLDGTPIPAVVTAERVRYFNEDALMIYVRDLREHNKMMDEITRQSDLLYTLNYISSILLDPEIDKFGEVLMCAFDIIAKAIDIDRVYIWKNHTKDGELYSTQMYEWSQTAEPQQNNEYTVDMPYKETMPGWEEILSQGECINAIVRDMSEQEQAQLSPQGILSIFISPVFFKDKFWGFVGFDDCRKERVFTENEEMILRSVSRLLYNAIIRNDMTVNIRTTAAQLEAVVNNHPGIIWSVNRDRVITLFKGLYLNKLNTASGRIVNLIGKNISDIPANALHGEISEYIEKTFKEGAQEWISKDSGDEVYHIHTTPIRDNNGEITDVVGIIDDITELISLQDELEAAVYKANEASKAKSDFLARMSHEIRTPINAVIGMTELALREENIDDAKEHIITVKQAGANLLSIINDILDFSKIEMGKINIVEGDYMFSSLLNDVISIIRMRVLDSQVRFVVNVDNAIPTILYGDEVRIRQVLINILGNAVKYTDEGFISFNVTGEMTDEENINLLMEVVDSGKGIKPEDIDTLFEEYFQSDIERNKGIEGVGLGLTIAHSIVNSMGGEISVQSEYGEGSVFTIILPQKVRNKQKLAEVEDAGNKKVLIYERREIYANSIGYTVDNLGVFCSIVTNDSELHDELINGDFSFIFVSFALYEKHKELISKFGKNAKIVLLTEFGEAIPDKGLSVISMPAYSVSVANILNGMYSNYSYSESNESIARFTAPNAKILVVDDINTNLKVAKGLLTPYKTRIDLCTGGMEAIKMMQSEQYDLVFMDHRMPEMDGMEATQRIRDLVGKDQYYKNVPVIALTANAVSGTKEMFLENGFNDFLSKPIDTIKLNTIMEKWIPKSKQVLLSEESVRTEKKNNQNNQNKEYNINIKIGGVDVNKGIMISGGTVDGYVETLEVFYQDGKEKIIRMTECLEKNEIKLYTVYAHALKSASANIGADDLSETAKSLESAGDRGDTDFIGTNNYKFLKSLELLLENINKFLLSVRKNKNNTDNINEINNDILKHELLKLKTAIDEMDAGSINKIISGLQKSIQKENVAAAVKNISDNILLGEYDEAISLIDLLLQEEG